MKSVSILITNHNAGDTVALCIESIRKYTEYPHTIIVHDDATNSKEYDDLTYLRAVRDKGWIRLIESNPRIMHGESITKLLASATSDLAVILDCDIQITGSRWLRDMVEAQVATGACIVADMKSLADDDDLEVEFPSWFSMMDLKQYPHVEAEWSYLPKGDGGYRMTGWQIWKKAHDQNRTVTPLPESVRERFCHHTHISVLSLPKEGPNYAIWLSRYAVIQAELSRLRREA